MLLTLFEIHSNRDLYSKEHNIYIRTILRKRLKMTLIIKLSGKSCVKVTFLPFKPKTINTKLNANHFVRILFKNLKSSNS